MLSMCILEYITYAYHSYMYIYKRVCRVKICSHGDGHVWKEWWICCRWGWAIMLTWIYRRRGGWVASQQSFQQSAVSWTISTWIKIIQTGKNKYNIEVMSEQVLLVFPGGSKGCEPAQIDTHTHATANHAMQQPQQPVELPFFYFLFCWKTHHSMPTLPTGKLVISLWESVESDLCSVLCHSGNFPHQKLYHGFLMFLDVSSAPTSLSAISGRSGTKESGRPGSHAPNSLGIPKPFMMRQSMA